MIPAAALAVVLLAGLPATAFADACTLNQITDDTIFSLSASISADGNRIVFRSPFDFLGTNGDGNAEIFLYDVASSSVIVQVTDTTGSFSIGGDPVISGDGTRVAFFSNV